jgi:Zn-dependent protease
MTTQAGRPMDEPGHGVRIARVAGIPVYVASSWFLVAAVIVVIVAGPVLDTRPLYGIGVGVVQALLLLVSVLVHEAAHAVAARSFGMPVLRIVANLWGGHTAMEEVRAAPGRLALVAAAGPLANGLLALVALVALQATTGDLSGRVLEGLVLINGSLAVLNILPGLPLDGGQVLECLVWKATGDRNRGAVVAGWCGRLLALALVLWFCVRPLARGEGIGFSAVWVLLIGSVLWTGATGSITRGRALGALQRLRVGDVVERAVLLPPDAPLSAGLTHPDAVVTTDPRGVPCLVLLVEDGAGSGQWDPSAPLVSAVSRLPDGNVVEAAPGDDVLVVVQAMQASSVGVVVVTEHGRPWGLAHARLVNEAARRN